MLPKDIGKYVLWSLDHTGWYADLWFPRIRRDHINFPAGPTDAEVYDALFGLIRKGWIKVSGKAGDPLPRADHVTAELLFEVQADGEATYTLDLDESIRCELNAALERSKFPPRGHFELSASGKDFDVDLYLKSARLSFDCVWRRSEDGPATSGVAQRLGNGAEIPLGDQERIAVEYLETNCDALQHLRKFPGVTTMSVGLQHNAEFGEGLRRFVIGPSSSLMWHALNVGACPTFHVVLNKPGEIEYDLSLETFLTSW